MVAFAEAWAPIFDWVAATYDLKLDRRWVSVTGTLLLITLMLTKGADIGVWGLWAVSAILVASIGAFLLGEGPVDIRPEGLNITARIADGDNFSTVFATCFPAFTGMIAGLGLSGDLRNPQRSIPIGTIGATLAGMVIYALVAVKLAQSVTPEELAADQFVMTKIALWGPAIYVGLGAAALSSAIGSLLVAPRTLQMLGRDNVLPFSQVNRLMERGVGQTQEPVYATCVSGAIAIVFVMAGDVDFIARILTMFFIVTYGVSLCSIVPRALRRQSVLSSYVSFSLVFVVDWHRDVRLDDDSDKCAVRIHLDHSYGDNLPRTPPQPPGGTRLDSHFPRDYVPVNPMVADYITEEPCYLTRRWVASINRCRNPIW